MRVFNTLKWAALPLAASLAGCSFFGNPVDAPPATMLAYISMRQLDQIAVVSLIQRTPASDPLPGGTDPANMVLNPRSDREFLYVANHNSNTVSFVNVRSHQVEKPVESGGSNPWDIAITPGGQMLFVTNTGDKTVGQIDVEARSRIHTFQFPPDVYFGFQPRGIATHPTTSESPNKNDAYVISEGQYRDPKNPGDIAKRGLVVQLRDRNVGSPIVIDGAVKLWKAAVTPKGDRLLITDRGSSKLWTVDLATGTPGQSIELGVTGSWDVVTNSSIENPVAYVSLVDQGQVVAVDLNSNSAGNPVGVMPVGANNQPRKPQALAVNRQGTELWVALAGSSEVVYFPGIDGVNMPVGPRLVTYSYNAGQTGSPEDIVLGRGVQ